MKDFDLHPPAKVPEFPTFMLPAVDLGTLDLGQELADNLSAARQLRLDITNDHEIPANQKAQVMNTITAILTNIVKLQTELYSAQRQKELEAILISVLRDQPLDLQDKFFAEYEARLQ